MNDKHEMTAKEFLQTMKRMCYEDGGCGVCPMHKAVGPKTTCATWRIHHPDEAIAIVEQWAKEHPVDVKFPMKGKWLCESTKCRIGYNDYECWNKWRCSCCGYIRTEGWEHTSEGQEPNVHWCENCGADMRRQNE